MARVPTERVTVRLNQQHLYTIDAMVALGEIRNRTHAISDAVKDWLKQKAPAMRQVEESARAQLDVQKLASTIAELQAKVNHLSKK